MSHVPGKDLTTADALSRSPAAYSPTRTDELLQQETSAYLNLTMEYLSVTEQRLQQIRDCQISDMACQQIMEFCQSGWTKK